MPSDRPGGARESFLDWVLLLEPLAVAAVDSDDGLLTGSGIGTSWVTSVAADGRARQNAGTVGCSFNATSSVTVTQASRVCHAVPATPPAPPRSVARTCLKVMSRAARTLVRV